MFCLYTLVVKLMELANKLSQQAKNFSRVPNGASKFKPDTGYAQFEFLIYFATLIDIKSFPQ